VRAAPPASIHRETPRAPTNANKPAPRPPTRKCDVLSDQLGRVFDQMDQARSKGATQKQMDEWNQEIKALEQEKQQSGCF